MKKSKPKQAIPLPDCRKLLRIMKMLIICLLLGTNIVWGSLTYAQRTSLDLNFTNVELEEVFDAIRQQSEFEFFYNNDQVNTSVKVSVRVENGGIKEVLEQVLPPVYEYKISDRYVLISKKKEEKTQIAPVFPQQIKKEVQGKVVDEQGEPVIGANVMEKGTTNGVITDIDGEFTLFVSDNTMLQVSYIGYMNQDISVKNKSQITIILKEDTQALEEVVIIGYGTQKKANLSGAVAQIDNDVLQNRPLTNLSSGLQGLMPGITVTSGQGRPGMDNGSIRIRGVGTLNTSDPYILIDGMETGTLNSIDLNDVESITVLKDASSAAIYGSKASNGVILITTKRGKSGKPQLSYHGYVGFQNPTALIDRLSSADYATLYNRALEAENKMPRFTQEEIQKFKDGSDPYRYPDTDWNDLAFRTGIQHQHNVSLNGGNEYMKYMVSVGYLNQRGILPHSEREQLNARTNLDVDISEKISVRMNMAYVNNDYMDPTSSQSSSSGSIFLYLQQITPWIPYKHEDGTYGTSEMGNPIAWLDLKQVAERMNQNFSGLFAVDYNIKDNLQATIQGAYANNNQHFKHFRKDIQYNANLYHGPNQLTETFYNWKRTNFDALLNYNNNWNSHNLKVMLGYHAEKYNYRENTMLRKEFPNNSLDDMNAGTTSTQTNGGYTRELAMLSYFGRVNYDFAGKYLFEANFRADASSRFSPGNRWGYFPSFSAAWRISEESFMESTNSWLDNLKIRGSWGLLGNQDALTDYYPWLDSYNIGANYPFNGSLRTGYYRGSYKLPSISWEKSRTWGIGVDMNFLSHYSLSVDYYNRLTSDIIMDVPVPTEFALGAYKDNVGEMVNKGIEVLLGYNNTWNDWRLSLTGNFSYNKNEILDLGGVERMIEGSKIKQIGHPINSYYVYKADGFFQSDAEAQAFMDKYKNQPGYPFGHDFKAGDLIYQDINGDGKIDSEDRIITHATDPKYTYGMNFALGWKNLDLTTIFTGVSGVSRYFHTAETFGDFVGDISHPATIWLDAWSADNPNGKMPRISDGRTSPSHSLNTSSTFWLKDASYLRMKNLQLSYTLPQKWISNLGISQMKIYYSGENLFTIDSLPVKVDPEAPDATGSFYPVLRSHSFGLNLVF